MLMSSHFEERHVACFKVSTCKLEIDGLLSDRVNSGSKGYLCIFKLSQSHDLVGLDQLISEHLAKLYFLATKSEIAVPKTQL
jgi:hypothetical protein